LSISTCPPTVNKQIHLKVLYKYCKIFLHFSYWQNKHPVILRWTWTTPMNLTKPSFWAWREPRRRISLPNHQANANSAKRRRSFSITWRSLQDDGMSEGRFIWDGDKCINHTITPNRHSEPGVNHGEESHCWIIKQMSVKYRAKEILQRESSPASGWR